MKHIDFENFELEKDKSGGFDIIGNVNNKRRKKMPKINKPKKKRMTVEDLSIRLEDLAKIVAEGFKNINAEIRGIKITLAEHSRILEEHSRILAEHSRILEEHSRILAEHSRILEKHSDIFERNNLH
jgi:hypothetical protein